MRLVRLACGVARAPEFYPCFRIDSRFMLRRGPIWRPPYTRYQVEVQVRRNPSATSRSTPRRWWMSCTACRCGSGVSSARSGDGSG